MPKGEPMTTELTTMWATIAEAYPYALLAIPRSSQPSDGQPTGTKVNAPSPVNDTAQSWCAEVEQAAFGWASQGNNANERIHWLTNNLPAADDIDLSGWEDFTKLSERLAQEAQRFIPAETQVKGITADQARKSNVHCETIQLLVKTLKAIGHPTPEGTLHYWVHEGWLTKTPQGYPLADAIERRQHNAQ